MVIAWTGVTPARAWAQSPGGRVRLRLDTAEAVAALGLLSGSATDSLPGSDWNDLLAAEGYRRLKAREAAMGRPFSDTAFARFCGSDSVRRRRAALRRTLSVWERADLGAAAARALAYLPPNAHIVATVYVVIKPQPNSFVWDADTDPAIFLYLDPDKSAAAFANTVTHELHHIGLASVAAPVDSLIAALPDSVQPVARWIGTFGEGFAMLAAAGGPDIHPHATSPAADRARWDADMARFNEDLHRLDQFFTDILTRRLPSRDSIRTVGMTFFGVQGPWYTVGWRMAVLIERHDGRAELIRCMTDPERLLSAFNRAAAEYNRTHPDLLAEWSAPVVAALIPPR